MGCLVLLLGLALTCNATGDVPVEGVHLSWSVLGWLLIIGGLFWSSGSSSANKK